MSPTDREHYLPLALRVIALITIFGVYPLTVLWPSGWVWHTEARSEYLEMIMAIYATLGVFLWLASNAPLENLSLISFTIWSSIVHGAVMAFQSLADTQHIGHLYGDVPALFLVAALLAWLSPRALTLGFSATAA